jgi:hypothetical protein
VKEGVRVVQRRWDTLAEKPAACLMSFISRTLENRNESVSNYVSIDRSTHMHEYTQRRMTQGYKTRLHHTARESLSGARLDFALRARNQSQEKALSSILDLSSL